MPAPLVTVLQHRLAQPFTTDGCTNWPDGPWKACCEKHDRYYRYASLAGLPRKRGDLELYYCVKAKGYPIQARLMYMGVRTFGGAIWRQHKKLGGQKYSSKEVKDA